MSDLVLDRIAAAATAVLDGAPPAPQLARDLAAVARIDPLVVTVEATTTADIVLGAALGADRVRLDGDAFLASAGRPWFRRCLVATGAHDRPLRLDALRALVAEQAASLLAAAGSLEVAVALGGRPARDYFPASPPRAAEVIISLGLPATAAAAALEAMAARAGRLGVRGARWIADDPELFLAIAGGWLDAARGRRPLGFVVPAVSFAGELVAARRVIELARATTMITGPIPLGAGIESARGVLAIDAIEREADFIELDLQTLTETCLALSVDDAPRCLPQMIEAALLAHDPFVDLDPAIAALLTAAYRPHRVRTARGAVVLGARCLARLDDFAIGGLTVPARAAAAVRIARARRGIFATARARAGELEQLAATAPRHIADGPPPVQPGTRAGDFLEQLVGEVARGALAPRDVIGRIPPALVDTLGRPVLDDANREPLAVGLGVAPGAGVGRIALSPAAATKLVRAGEPVILVVREVYGDEAAAVRDARGLISTRGGRTSHAALVAANNNVPCVIDEHIGLSATAVTIAGRVLAEGDWLSIDGSTGAIYADRIPLVASANEQSFAALLRWSDEARRMRVLANADTPETIAAALAGGADGIGLVRTENMFLEAGLLESLRAMLVGDGDGAELEARQREGFAARLAAAGDAPITFRLLDASLYELLPHDRAGVTALARSLNRPLEEIARQVDRERPIEPAMSLRASRLALLRPGIERAQVRALAGAWFARPRTGRLRVMVPMIVSGAEAAAVKARLVATIAEVARAHDAALPALAIGFMIETPRAALDAAAIAAVADFFAWGSNDLTQFTIGIARSVFPLVVPRLQAAGALDHDPSETLDLPGLGSLIHVAEALARAANPTLVTGVCGNLASDPRSIRAFHALGLDYVSVPLPQLARTRLAAAQISG